MTWTINDFTLGATSAVSEATDGPTSASLVLYVTPAERRQLEEMFAFAGSYETFTGALGELVAIDTTGGRNTFYVSSGATNHFDSGWFVCRSISDGWTKGPQIAVLRLDLVRVSGDFGVRGSSIGSAEFLAHDF